MLPESCESLAARAGVNEARWKSPGPPFEASSPQGMVVVGLRDGGFLETGRARRRPGQRALIGRPRLVLPPQPPAKVRARRVCEVILSQLAARDQRLREMRSDEPGAAGDETEPGH